MLETTPTHGSTECSADERKRMAADSRAFNLGNETFCELFPEICTEITVQLKHEADERLKVAEAGKSNQQIGGGGGGDGDLADVAECKTTTTRPMPAGLSNLVVLISFGVFAVLVNYILKSLTHE